MRPTLILLFSTTLLSCQSETGITQGLPVLGSVPDAIDFGEQNVGQEASASWTIQNSGIGDLEITAADYVGDPELFVKSVPEIVEANGEAVLEVGYRPDVEEDNSGVLTLQTNAPDHEVISLKLAGHGVVARLEVSPMALYFGQVDFGDSYTQSVTLSSIGSGDLVLEDVEFPEAEAVAYSWALAGGAELPHAISPGHAINMDITYAPPLQEDFSGDLVLVTNDIDTPYHSINLLAGDVDGCKIPPEISIVEPGWGTRWVEGEPIQLAAHAVDADDGPESIGVLVYVDEVFYPAGGQPDAEGNVEWNAVEGDYTLDVNGVGAGTHTIKVVGIDPCENTGQATVEIEVDPPEELEYTITGGDSLFEFFDVDDDIEITVDGEQVFLDDDQTSGLGGASIAPVAFEAGVGSEIRIIATDAKPCARSITDLWLHFGSEHRVQLVEATSVSGNGGSGDCNGREDYDPEAYDEPPYVFLDETFTISIP